MSESSPYASNVTGRRWSRFGAVFWHGPELTFAYWYVNLQSPFTRTTIGIHTFDHTLDIVVQSNGTWWLKDADELESDVLTGRFTQDEADEITAEAASVGRLLDGGRRSWGDEWRSWTPDPTWSAPTALPPRWDVVG